jgi:ABC-type thiamine transport system ATPase subunit
MPTINTTVTCPIFDSFRVQQVAGMFDVPLAEKASASFSVEVPDLDEPWQIGLIVGPSGSGKSTIARAAFGEALVSHFDWPADKAVVDCFGELPIKAITHLLTAVGFSSPPSWVKPHAVLSGGEKFRCDLARALSARNALVVFDEFTSVVDRNVARIGSAAVAKYIRKQTGSALRFVAVSCHYDIANWLEPDWVVDTATATCTRRRLRRPEIQLRLHRATTAAWPLFAKHHYLSGKLNPSARCYLAWWHDEPVAFLAVLPAWGNKHHDRASRIVVLPDYQGIGIGTRVTEMVAELHRSQGRRFSLTTGHPATIAHCLRSHLWQTVQLHKHGSRQSRGRATVSFEYVGAGVPRVSHTSTQGASHAAIL